MIEIWEKSTIMERKKILEIRHFSVDFHTTEGTVHAINSLDYELQAGETLGIVGESGSGKSVSSLGLMRLIPNPPGEITDGEILFHEQDLLKLSEKEMEKIRGNKISMIFQEPMTSLNPILTCGDQIAESLIYHRNMKKKEALREAEKLMCDVGIANADKRLHEYPHQMSGGMKQRIMIAMALACEPDILICDEPTTALDVTIQAQILDLIRKLNKEKGTSIIMITHDFGVVSELCERVIVMYTGKIVEEAPAEKIFEKPLHPYTEGLIESIPQIMDQRKTLSTIDGTVPNPTETITGCSFWPRCRYATEKCKIEEPPVFCVSQDRKVRCWRYDKQNG
jgi:oligopeptide/dipeptide ABC transporter ATP-binding protein